MPFRGPVQKTATRPRTRHRVGSRPAWRLRPETPRPADVVLLVEVAESSLSEDRRLLRLYARSGIPVVWIVNLNNNTVEVYDSPTTDPDNPRYGVSIIKTADDHLEITDGDRLLGTIAVSALLS